MAVLSHSELAPTHPVRRVQRLLNVISLLSGIGIIAIMWLADDLVSTFAFAGIALGVCGLANVLNKRAATHATIKHGEGLRPLRPSGAALFRGALLYPAAILLLVLPITYFTSSIREAGVVLGIGAVLIILLTFERRRLYRQWQVEAFAILRDCD